MAALRNLRKSSCLALLLNLVVAASAFAQKALTWQEVRAKFEALNPTLRAGLIGIDESRASEITAFLRPNPDFTLSVDGTQIAPNNGVWQPFKGTMRGPLPKSTWTAWNYSASPMKPICKTPSRVWRPPKSSFSRF